MSGLSTGINLLKSDFKSWEIPKFIEAFILMIWYNPSIERWAPLLINSITFLNNIKSAAFSVNNGKLKKCGIIIVVKFFKIVAFIAIKD